MLKSTITAPAAASVQLPAGFEVIHPADAIAAAVRRLADGICRRHRGDELMMVAVLDGALVFAADLLRQLPLRTRLATVRASSYRQGAHNPGELHIEADLPDLRGRHVVLVDDIIDSGHTLTRMSQVLMERSPASLQTCVLLDKPAGRQVDVSADQIGLQVPDRFVVGYGLDDDGLYRNLPCIAAAIRPAEAS